uniref:Exocyst complex component EXO70A1 n=2 Tax=Noccaea caerulescens TaxID=107243 RepID=A0A1J3HHC3_NOCCA
MRTAMKHLEKEFYRLLKANRRVLDPEPVSGWSSDSNTPSRSSGSASGSESDGELDPQSSSELGNESRGGGGDADADAIVDLKMIANGMISSGYEKDCLTIYKKLRKKVIVDAFSRLGFEKLNSTQMMKLEWEILEKKIKQWMPVTTVAVTTLFNGERILCDHIFSSSVVDYKRVVEIADSRWRSPSAHEVCHELHRLPR